MWVEESLGFVLAFSPEGIFTMTSRTAPDGDPVAGTWGVIRNNFALCTSVSRPSQIWSEQVSEQEAAALVNGSHDLSYVMQLGRQRGDLRGTLRIWNAHFDAGNVVDFAEWDEEGALSIPILFRPAFRVYSMVPEVGGGVAPELLPILYELDPGSGGTVPEPDEGGQQGGARPKDAIPYDQMPGSQAGVH